MSTNEANAIARLEKKVDSLNERVEALDDLLRGDGKLLGIAAKVELLWQTRGVLLTAVGVVTGCVGTKLVDFLFAG